MAFDAICAVEDVSRHRWLRESTVKGVRTPDLEVVINGLVVTVEITAHTNSAINALFNTAEKINPVKATKLSHDWVVYVSDSDIAHRSQRRTLKTLVKAIEKVLKKAEEQGGAPETIQECAAQMLNSDPFDPYEHGPQSDWWKRVNSDEWSQAEDPDKRAQADISSLCDYWYPLDLADRVTAGLRPRHVRVSKPAIAQGNGGSINVYPTASGGACVLEAVDCLVPVIQEGIDKKQNRGQMQGVSGDKWLAVYIDGGCAALQLESAAESEQQSQFLGQGNIEFTEFDEVWVIGPTFSTNSFAVVRLAKPGTVDQRHIVPRP